MKPLARLCYLSLLLSLPLISAAQSNFRPGTITLTDGTSISGYVRVNNWNTTPLKLAFKQERGNAPTTYSPNELLGFEAEGYLYQSALVNVEVSPSDLKSLDYSSSLDIVLKHIFIQQILGGDKPLFLNRTQRGKKNFYIKEQDQFTLLKHKQYKQRNRSGADKVRVNRSYIADLVQILDECPGLNHVISQTAYTQKSLIQLLNSYSHCSGSAIDYQIRKRKVPITYGFLAGATRSHLYFESLANATNTIQTISSKNSLDPTAGGFINITLPFDQSKWSIHNEVLITHIQSQVTYRNIINENNFSTSTVAINSTHLKLNHFLRYTYRFQKLSILINGGVSQAILINQQDEQVSRPHDLGVTIGSGVRIGQWSLETRFEKTSQIAVDREYKATTERIYLLLGYQF